LIVHESQIRIPLISKAYHLFANKFMNIRKNNWYEKSLIFAPITKVAFRVIKQYFWMTEPKNNKFYAFAIFSFSVIYFYCLSVKRCKNPLKCRLIGAFVMRKLPILKGKTTIITIQKVMTVVLNEVLSIGKLNCSLYPKHGTVQSILAPVSKGSFIQNNLMFCLVLVAPKILS